MAHVALVCAAAGPGQRILAPLVAGLCVMRQSHPALYRKARRKDLTWEEARNFLQPAEGRGVDDEWALEWWEYATGGEMSQEKVGRHAEVLAQYGVRDRKDLIPLMADYIDDLVQHRNTPEDQ